MQPNWVAQRDSRGHTVATGKAEVLEKTESDLSDESGMDHGQTVQRVSEFVN